MCLGRDRVRNRGRHRVRNLVLDAQRFVERAPVTANQTCMSVSGSISCITACSVEADANMEPSTTRATCSSRAISVSRSELSR